MSKIRVIGPIIKGVSRQGIPGMVAAVIKHLKSVDQLSELLDQCQITPGKLISLASCSFAIDSNKETRDSNVDISTEFVYNGNRYYLYKEIEGGQFDRFISKFNEIFSSDYIIEKNSITHNGKERDCFYMYDLHSNPNEDESEKDDNETIDNNQKNNKAKLSNSKIKEQLPFDTKVVIDTISATGLIFDPKFVQRYLCSLLTKPFVILSGLTGSGKTQLAMAFPKLICENKSQYKLIPVGADWTNREQLLGYPNALRPGEYVMPDNGALQLILEASKPENQNKPYFLVLDEMNMSYVERYFADFLSAMESGEEIPLWEGNKKVPATITLPKNLFIIGTINVDETTYMFSPKVLDRANVIEFRINKEQMLEYLGGTGKIAQIENRAERAADFVATASKEFAGALSNEMKETLISMFDTLSKIQKEFGYRTAHEMSRFITICKCFTDMSDEEAIDASMVQKLLPKIHGSRKKISPVLTALWQLCYKADAVEIDTLDAMPENETFKYPLTAEKIWRMYQIAQDNGFTSFAEA